MKKLKILFSALAFVVAIGASFTSKSSVDIEGYIKPAQAPCQLKRSCNNVAGANCMFGATPVFRLTDSGTQCNTPLSHWP